MKKSDLQLRARVETRISPQNGGFITCKTVASIQFSTEIEHGNVIPSGSLLESAQKEARERLAECVFGQTWNEMKPLIGDIKRLATSQNIHEVNAIVREIYRAFGRDFE